MYAINDAFIKIPNEMISSRLTMRSFQPSDGLLVQEAVKESLSELQEWLTWAYKFQGQCPGTDYFKQISENLQNLFIMKNELHFLLLDKETKEVIGSCSVHDINWLLGSAEIGYWCRTSKVGNGYIKEAVQTIIEMIFESMELNQVHIVCDIENKKSLSIPESLGFKIKNEDLGLIAKPGIKQLRKGRLYVLYNANQLMKTA